MKTEGVINKARGGTLLVDEAYQLIPPNSPRDSGIEAVEAIMSTIEGGSSTDDDRPAYIFAGYPAEMERFMSCNAGLRRRVTHKFLFADYAIVELAKIFNIKCKQINMVVTEDVTEPIICESIGSIDPHIRSQHNAGLCEKLLTYCTNKVNK